MCGVKKGRNKRQDYRGKQEPGQEYLKQSLILYQSSDKVLKGLKLSTMIRGLPWWLRGESVCLQCRKPGFNPWVRKIPWRRKWQSIPVFLPGESHGQRSLVGYSPWGCKESDMTERLHLIRDNTKAHLHSSVLSSRLA